ncbi:MAG: hypothetical protein LBJ11_02910 [Oscillospiraceae bacterium]|jgi:anti-sigma factor RsiW|nr:hypothetical protein [Oscillospiraceae bacterium]
MNHIEDEAFRGLLGGSLPPETLRRVLEHVAWCDGCAGRLAELTEALPPPELPADLTDRIYAKAKVVPFPQQRQNRPESLRSFTLRVLAAMAATLILLFSGTFHKLGQLDFNAVSQAVHQSVVGLTQFTDQLFTSKEDSRRASQSQQIS